MTAKEIENALRKQIMEEVSRADESNVQNLTPQLQRVMKLLMDTRNTSKLKIDEDLNLYGYIHFLVSKGQFKYTSAYLMDKISAFSDRVESFRGRVAKMCNDFQTIIQALSVWDAKVSLVVDDWLVLSGPNKANSKEKFRASFRSEALDRILQFDKGKYHIQVMWGDASLGAFVFPATLSDQKLEGEAKRMCEYIEQLINLRHDGIESGNAEG